MEALAETHRMVKLRRIDIGSWDSPVADQYAIRRLPTVWLYIDGKLYSKELDAVAKRLRELP